MTKRTHPRTAAPQGKPSATPPDTAPDYPEGIAWVPLREAADAAGVSVSALRKWYTRGDIPSRMEPGPTGERRLVPLEAVLERAGRHRPADYPARVGPAPVPEGMALVPAADWERMLSIAVRYAEAGERVGRAEEKAEHYHARLVEAREEHTAALTRERERIAALEAELREERSRFRLRRIRPIRGREQ